MLCIPNFAALDCILDFFILGSSQVHRHSLTLWIVTCEYMCMYVYVCICVHVYVCVCMRFSLWSGG